MKRYFVYVLHCADGTFYTGWTNDLERRLHLHNKGLASKYTRGRLPATLYYQEELGSKSEAMKREHALKQLSREQKKALVS